MYSAYAIHSTWSWSDEYDVGAMVTLFRHAHNVFLHEAASKGWNLYLYMDLIA